MAIVLQPEEKNLWRVVQAIIQLTQGRSNSTGVVTLAAGVTVTVVSAVNCSKGSRVFLTPETANAAAALATTYIKATDILQGSFTITHANTGTTDRTFGWDARGG